MVKGKRRGWPSAPAIAAACLIGAHLLAGPSASPEAASPPARAVFAGYDSQAHLNLWVTDGTSAGTHELPAAGAAPNGLLFGASPEFTPLGKKLLFVGTDKAGKLGLWVTDGTLTGTKELAVAGAYSGGLFRAAVPDFTVFRKKVLFAGSDNKPHPNVVPVGLWVTDGTAAGTSELKVLGINSNGLNPGSFIALGTKALFVGHAGQGDFPGPIGLWVTDGTSAGTKQLMVTGADPDGVFFFFGKVGPDATVLDSPDFTLLNGKVLFQGFDTKTHSDAQGSPQGDLNLWVSNGTAAATKELTVVGANPTGLFEDSYYPHFTVLGRKALFQGFASRTSIAGSVPDRGLWVTDGTSAGTAELKVGGAYRGGLFSAKVEQSDPEFTTLGRNVLFAGVDAGGRLQLWVTNLTSAGTKALPVVGSGSTGLFGGVSRPLLDPDFTVFGKKVLFAGFDRDGFSGIGKPNLWATDGTSAGTKELTVAGASSAGLNPTGFSVLGTEVLFSGAAAARDFIGLWSTDGTAAGTRQVIVAEAWSGGLWPSNITALPR